MSEETDRLFKEKNKDIIDVMMNGEEPDGHIQIKTSTETKLFIPVDENNPLFVKLWREFSEIQCAVFLEIEKQSLERFQKWILTGDNEQAWS